MTESVGPDAMIDYRENNVALSTTHKSNCCIVATEANPMQQYRVRQNQFQLGCLGSVLSERNVRCEDILC